MPKKSKKLKDLYHSHAGPIVDCACKKFKIKSECQITLAFEVHSFHHCSFLKDYAEKK